MVVDEGVETDDEVAATFFVFEFVPFCKYEIKIECSIGDLCLQSSGNFVAFE